MGRINKGGGPSRGGAPPPTPRQPAPPKVKADEVIIDGPSTRIGPPAAKPHGPPTRPPPTRDEAAKEAGFSANSRRPPVAQGMVVLDPAEGPGEPDSNARVPSTKKGGTLLTVGSIRSSMLTDSSARPAKLRDVTSEVNASNPSVGAALKTAILESDEPITIVATGVMGGRAIASLTSFDFLLVEWVVLVDVFSGQLPPAEAVDTYANLWNANMKRGTPGLIIISSDGGPTAAGLGNTGSKAAAAHLSSHMVLSNASVLHVPDVPFGDGKYEAAMAVNVAAVLQGAFGP